MQKCYIQFVNGSKSGEESYWNSSRRGPLVRRQKVPFVPELIGRRSIQIGRVKLLNSKSITERSPHPFPDVISNCNYFISDLKLNTNLPWNAPGAIDFSWIFAKFKNWIRVTSVKLKVSVSMAEMLLKSRLMAVSKGQGSGGFGPERGTFPDYSMMEMGLTLGDVRKASRMWLAVESVKFLLEHKRKIVPGLPPFSAQMQGE